MRKILYFLSCLVLLCSYNIVYSLETFLKSSMRSSQTLMSKSYGNYSSAVSTRFLRLYSSDEWNKGFVPHTVRNSFPSEWNKGKIPSENHMIICSEEQQNKLSAREWRFSPTRSLFYYRHYYNKSELEQLEQNEKQNAQILSPVMKDEDTVEFSLEKKK